jgi:decaprenylphospho-beta-D-erythro-pentofuranosid-2-ulose 2-reductase
VNDTAMGTSSNAVAARRVTAETFLILGATSGIAQAICQVLAARGCRLVLAGRNGGELERLKNDLQVRHQTVVECVHFDALDFASHAVFVERCTSAFDGGLDGAILCYGYMVEQQLAQSDFAAAQRTIDVNFTSAVSVLERLAFYFSARRRGVIAAISSVAGDRGRQSNYIYGASKAGLSAYLQGLRNRLSKSGVHVLTIKPGFVATAMTDGLVNPKSPLLASPERVARHIDRAIRLRRNVIYTPWFWRPIMLVIRSIPEVLFKRMKL